MDSVTYSEFKQICVHIRFLKRACNGAGVHPFDVEGLFVTRELLAKSKVGDLKSNGIDVVAVMNTVMEIDLLLGTVTIGTDSDNDD